MRHDWQQRAIDDPLHYIATDKRDPHDFAESGIADLRPILDGVPPGGNVLEIGAGIGRLLVPIEDRFDDLVGVDIAPRMVEMSDDYLHDHPKIRVLLNDGTTLPFADASFDFVFSYITFQHIPERSIVERYIAEAYRVVKPGGVFRFQVVHQSRRQSVLRPLRLDGPTTWRGYNWTKRRLRATLNGSPVGRFELRRRNTQHLWATCWR